MKDYNDLQKQALNSGYSISPRPITTLEWNWNRYRSFAVVDNIKKDKDYNTNYDIAPIDEIVKGDRPPAGIAKAIVGQAKIAGEYDENYQGPRFYLSGPHDPYKYWLSPNVSASKASINLTKKDSDLDVLDAPISRLTTIEPPEVTTIQSIVKDTKRFVWFTQITEATTGTQNETPILVRCYANGNIKDQMTLTGAGHGVSLGIEYEGDNPVVYMVWDGKGLVKFNYIPGLSISGDDVTQLWPDPAFVGFNMEKGFCLFRYAGSGGQAQTELRRWTEVKAQTGSALKTISTPSADRDTYALQGLACDENYAYVLTGLSLPQRSYVRRYSWLDGSETKKDITSYGRFPDGSAYEDNAEPEGISFFRDNGYTALAFGVSTGGRDARKIFIYSFSQPKARPYYEMTSCQPRMAFNTDVNVNKIVIGVENSWAIPSDWEVQIGTGVYPHIHWKTIAVNPEVGSNGRVYLYLDDDGTWGQRSNWKNSTPIRGLRLLIHAMNRPNSYFSLIELSARHEKLYSDRTINYQYNYTMSEPDLVSPVGTASSNTGSIEFTNDDGHFYGQVLLKNVTARTHVLFENGLVKMGEMFVDDWNEGDGTMTAQLVDGSRILQERTVPSTMFRDKTAMEIIWAICNIVGFNDIQYLKSADDNSHKIRFWYCKGGQTAWELIQELARPHQLVVSFDENNVLTVRSNKYMFNKSRGVDGYLRGVANGNNLANIMSFGRNRDFQISQASVKWYGTTSPSKPTVVWQPDDDIVLRSTQLAKTMTRGAKVFTMKQSDAVIWPFSGRVFIQGEIIEYDAKRYIYYDKHKHRTTVWVTSQGQKNKIDRDLTYPGWKWKSKFNGDFRVSSRGYGPTGAIRHPVDIDYWQPASAPIGHDMKPNRKWMHQDKANSTLDIHTPNRWKKSDFYWATRGTVKNGGFKYYGTRLKFNKGNHHGMAGIVFGIYGTGAQNCYMVQVKTTKLCTSEKRKYAHEICVLKKSPSGYELLAPKSQSRYDNPKTKKVEKYLGVPANIAENVWHNLDVTYAQGKITVYLDGVLQMTCIDPGPNLPNRGRTGVFVRGGTNVKFEYFYATNGGYKETPDESTFIDKVTGGFTTVQYQHEFVYRERMKKTRGKWYKQKYGGTLFDEFGPIIHEARKFDFILDTPILSGRAYVSNDMVVCTDQTFRPFHTSFWLANASRDNQVVNGQDSLTFGSSNPVNQMLLGYGRQLTISDAKTITVTAGGRQRAVGDIDLAIDSKWIQTKAQAQDLADWVTDNWATEASEFSVEVWANPFYQLGDRVTINYPDHGVKWNQDYFVIAVSYGWDHGMTTNLTLRQVPSN